MKRARDLGIPFEGTPGRLNAITDVFGVAVGHTTIIEGEGSLEEGRGPVRTGVTAIMPRGNEFDPVFAGFYSLNGNGELSGTIWIEESGFLEGPIMLTNTHSVGIVRDAIVAWQYGRKHYNNAYSDTFWALPVVGETYDGLLNDINGFHVKPSHVFSALDNASSGMVVEGNVGGGTGMICHEYKGGIGTSSRSVVIEDDEYSVGVLVQANYGRREDLTIAGVRIGQELTEDYPMLHTQQRSPGSGSIIAIVATDAPLLPHQLKRLARRVPIGIGRVGGIGANSSGDIFLAFSTANGGAARHKGIPQLAMLPNDLMTPLMRATAQATEEAIINALVSAETMIGINGNTVYAMPHKKVQSLLHHYNRL